MATTIGLEVSYAQIAIFVSSLKNPFNDWTDRHVAQGFAWRPGSVSFRSMVEAGHHTIEIDIADRVGAVRSNAVRAIDVPFEVPVDSGVEVGSIADSVPLSLPAGSYLLRYEYLSAAGTAGEQVRLTFATRERPRFAIVRADHELSTGVELLTTAVPASG